MDGVIMDIVDRLKKWLEKDQVIARNWNENGFSIDGDIELAIEEIERLRKLLGQSKRCHVCGVLISERHKLICSVGNGIYRE